MSNWTHVAGVIRIDDFRFEDSPEVNFDELVGMELDFNDDEKKWIDADEHPEKFLPIGSEGSLKKSVWVNPDIDDVDSYAVTIFGDLRDHDDPDKIIEWFKVICSKFSIRNAVITAQNEVNGTRTWSKDYNCELESRDREGKS